MDSYTIYDPVLAYIAHGLLKSTPEHVKKVVHDHFSPNEIITARDALWVPFLLDSLPKMISRRNSTTSDKGCQLTISDVVDGIRALDSKGEMPRFVVEFSLLHRMPLSSPNETESISLCDRLARLEARLKTQEEMLVRHDDLLRRIPPAAKRAPQEKRPHDQLTHAQITATNTESASKSQSESASSLPREHPAATDKEDEDGWRTYRRKKRRRAITGSKTDASSFDLEPSRDVFVYRCNHKTDATVIDKYLRDDSVARTVVKVPQMEAKCSSFRVEVAASQFKQLLRADMWPEGVCVRRFPLRS